MKTGVSIPDPLFQAADRLASRLHLSRSELYARALEQYLAGETDEEITARLNEVYGRVDSSLDPAFDAAQRRAVAEPPGRSAAA